MGMDECREETGLPWIAASHPAAICAWVRWGSKYPFPALPLHNRSFPACTAVILVYCPDTLYYHVWGQREKGISMPINEPRNPQRNWQDDYNRWWNRKNGTPVKENPVIVGSERKKQ